MKNLILLILSTVTTLQLSYAQTKSDFSTPLAKGLKETYTVHGAPHSKLIIINNTKNKLTNTGMNPPANAPRIMKGDIKVDRNKIAQICWDILGEERIRQFATETTDLDDFLMINFATDNIGNILEIHFAFQGPLSITPAEIEKLEDNLKKNVDIQLNPKVFAGYKYYTVTIDVLFDRLANREPKSVI